MHTNRSFKRKLELLSLPFFLALIFLTLTLLPFNLVSAAEPDPLAQPNALPATWRSLAAMFQTWGKQGHASLQNNTTSNIVYSDDFSSGASAALWSDNRVQYFGAHSSYVLGFFGVNSGQADQTVSLALTSLPTHDALKISFDLITSGSWDGIHETQGDRWDFSVRGGPQLLDTSFSAWPDYALKEWWQNYPDTYIPCDGAPSCISTQHPGNSGASQVYNQYDVVYAQDYTFEHTASDVIFDFHGDLGGNLDENWGIDNVVVSAISYKQKVLLVDDDENAPDVRASYTETLDLIGVLYDVWDTNNAGEPATGDLAAYDTVIWFTGGASGSNVGPSSAAEAALDTFLDNGNSLLLSSQDYHASRGLTSLMSGKLGVSLVTDTVGYTSVCGAGPTLNGLGCRSIASPFANHNAELVPDGSAQSAFIIDSNPARAAGVQKTNMVYSSTFLGFPLEAFSNEDRITIINRVLNGFAGEELYNTNYLESYYSVVEGPSETVLADGKHVAELTMTLRDENQEPLRNRAIFIWLSGRDSGKTISQDWRTDENGEAHFYFGWNVAEAVQITVADLLYESITYAEEDAVFSAIPIDVAASEINTPLEVILSECGTPNEFEISVNLVKLDGSPYEGDLEVLFDGCEETTLWVDDGHASEFFTIESPRSISVTFLTHVDGIPDVTLYATDPISAIPGSIDYLSSVQLAPTTVLADGSSTAVLTLTLHDDFGNRIPNRPLELYIGDGSPYHVAEATSDANGQVVFDQHLYWQNSRYPVTWLEQGNDVSLYASDSLYNCHDYMELNPRLDFIAGPLDPAASHTHISTDTLRIGQEYMEITATLLTESGQPYANTYAPYGEYELRFNSAFISEGNADEYGRTAYTFGSHQNHWDMWHTAGPVTISLLTPANTGTVPLDIGTVEFLPGPAYYVTTASSANPIQADGQSYAVITATVFDEYSNVLKNETATFTSSEALTLTQFTPTSDDQGRITATVSSADVQAATISVLDQGSAYLDGDLHLNFIAGPANALHSNFIMTPTTVPANGVSTMGITLTLTDSWGHPVSDRPIELQTSGSSVSIAPSTHNTTTAAGLLTFTVASTVPEYKNFEIRDMVYGNLLELGDVEFIPAPPDPDLSSITVSPTTTLTIDGTTPAVISVTLRDNQGTPIQGLDVSLFASGTALTLTQPSVPSDAQGQSSGTLLTTQAQSVTLGAFVAAHDITLTERVTLTFVPGPIDPATSNISITPQTITADGVASAPLTVTLQDQFGNPIAGEPVSISITSGAYNQLNGQPVSGSTWAPIGLTDVSGVITAQLTSTRAETKTIAAQSSQGNLNTTATADFGPGAATQLHILIPGETLAPGAAPGKTGSPYEFYAGAMIGFTVYSVDAYWNVAPIETTFAISGTDLTATYPATETMKYGNRFVITVHTKASEYNTFTVSALDAPQLASATSTAFTLNPGPPAVLDLAMPDNLQLFALEDLTVTIYDYYGNISTDYTGTLHFSSSDPQASLPADYTFTSGNGKDNGTHTFAQSLSFGTPGDQSLDIEDPDWSCLSASKPLTIGNAIIEISTDTTWDQDAVVIDTLIVTNAATLNLIGSTTITAENIIVADGATISADGMGYGAASGPGAGNSHSGITCTGGGAGHGGWGGDASNTTGGDPYGDLYTPQQWGSGGGNAGSNRGGAGGGAIHLVVSDTLQLDGLLSANGANGASIGRSGSGGGAGGSLWISAQTVTGTGTLRANGGKAGTTGHYGHGGGGAGGRIALYTQTPGFEPLTWQAYGEWGKERGGAGTVYVNAPGAQDTLYVDNHNNLGLNAALMPGQYELGDIQLTGTGNLTIIDTGSAITLSGGLSGDGSANLSVEGIVNGPTDLTVDGVTLAIRGDLVGPQFVTTQNSGGLTLYANTPWRSGHYTFSAITIGANTALNLVSYDDKDGEYDDEYGVTLTLDNLTIDSGGTLEASALGYAQAAGPGAGASSSGITGSGGGAGHGGKGGDGNGALAGGDAYGDLYAPRHLGSGGGNADRNSGGAGGGAVRLLVDDTLTISGTLAADGGDGQGDNFHSAGGGAGGSIWITSDTLTGTGIIRANGGDKGPNSNYGNGGGGAGGRIAVTTNHDNFSGHYQINGGNGKIPGEHGTLVASVDPLLSTLTAHPHTNLIADGADATTLTVTLIKPGGGPAAGYEVALYVTQGSGNLINGQPAAQDERVSLGTSDANGVVTATFASTTAEVKTLDVWAGDTPLLNDTNVTFVAGIPSADLSLVWVTPERIAADGVATATVHVLLYDIEHNPIPGTTIVISDTGSGTTISTPQPTGSDGRTQAIIHSSTPQTATIHASAYGVQFQDSAAIEFVGADLSVSKSGPASGTPNWPVTYTLHIANEGLENANTTTVSDTLPAHTTFVTQNSPYTFTQNGNTLLWDLGTLPTGATADIQVNAQISASAPISTWLVNRVAVSTTTHEGDLSDNQSEASTYVLAPVPLLDFTPTAPLLVVEEGGSANRMVTITNRGTAVMSDVHVAPPPNIDWVQLSPTTLPDLAPGESHTFTVTATPGSGLTTGYYRDRIWISAHGLSPAWLALTAELRGPSRDLQIHTRNDNGAIVAGAQVAVVRQEASVQVIEGHSDTFQRHAQGHSDSNGTLNLANLELGTYDVLAQAPDHDLLTGTLTLSPGSDALSHTLVLHARPRLSLAPNSITMTVTPDGEAFKTVYVRNNGTAPLHGLTIDTPQSIPWLSYGVPAYTDVISPSSQVPLLIYASPGISVSAGTYSDYVHVSSSDGGTAALAVAVTVIGEETRDIVVQLHNTLDNPVADAPVMLTYQEPTYYVTQGVTEAVAGVHSGRTNLSGTVVFPDMPQGAYNYNVAANAHTPLTGSLALDAGTEPLTLSLELDYLPFRYDWTVEKTSITDTYSVTLRMTYDTNSPLPTLFAHGDLRSDVTCGTPPSIKLNNFHIHNPTLIAIEVDNIDGVPINQVLPPRSSLNLDNIPTWTACGMNHATVNAVYPKAVGGPTYTFNPSGFTSRLLAPEQNFEKLYIMEVINPFNELFLEVGELEVLDWITLTNPYDGYLLTLDTGEQLGLTLDVDVPEWLAHGTYTETIPIWLKDIDKNLVKESYLTVVATQTEEGLRLHTTFDPGELQYTTGTFQVEAPFRQPCGCPHENDGWLIGGGLDMMWFHRQIETGFGSPPLSGAPSSPPIGYGHQQVRLEINQDVLLEREAFIATLTLSNSVESTLANMEIAIVISDTLGNAVTKHFAITPTTPTDVGNIPPGEARRVTWTMVPGDLGITDANGELFFARAVMSYSVGTEDFVVNTLAQDITVKPTPNLVLDYYIPGPDVQCSLWPLEVIARNVGYGWASNLRIDSGQPRIIDNPSQLLISFAILEAEVDGVPAPEDSLLLNFGDLAPGEQKQGSWLISSSLPGRFVEFWGDFKHNNVLGIPISPLIKEVNTYIVTSAMDEYEARNRNVASAFLASQTTANAGRGVNTFSGYFSENATDFNIPTRGLPLKLDRSYNSAAAEESGPLGYGWGHSYEMRLELGPGDDATFISQRGAAMRFYAQGGGEYQGAPGVRASLFKDENDTYTLTQVSQVRYTFDVSGTLQAEIDHNGNRNTMHYDGEDRLSAVRAPDGRELTFNYDGEDRLVKVTDPALRTVQFGYDTAGDMSVVTDTRGYARTFAYSEHRLTKIVDANGHTVVENLYEDSWDRVVRQTDGLGHATTFHYDVEDCTAGRTTTITNTRGFPRVDVYAQRGELALQRDALNQATHYTYDLNFNASAITDEQGRTTRYVSDEFGNPLKVTDPLSNVTESEYDAHHNLIKHTDPLGRVTTYAYDEHDNLITTTFPLSGSVINAYDAHGQMISTTDQNGAVTRYGYDTRGNRTTVTDALGNVTRSSYDSVGRVISQTNALSQTTIYTYDLGNNLTAVANAAGDVTRNTYDAVGNQTAVTNPRGYTTHLTYDARNQVLTNRDALDGVTAYTYDPMGNISAINDTRGYTTTTAYDPLDRPNLVRDPLGQEQSTAYDAVGNVIRVIDARGHVTHLDYDDLDRLITMTNALSGTQVTGYDAVGNTTVITDAEGRATYMAYDALDRLTVITNALGYTMTYQYDNLINPLIVTDTAGNATRYAYDALSRVITTSNALSYTSVNTYDALGNVIMTQNPRGYTSTVEYDVLNRPVLVVNALSGTTASGYDAVGNMIWNRNARGYTSTFEYDALNRTRVISNALGQHVSKTYDQMGNLTRETDARGHSTNYSYDEMGRLEIVRDALGGETTYGYDEVGNRTSERDAYGNVTRYEYDPLGQLTTIVDAQGNTTRYSYSPSGNKLSMQDAEGWSVHYAYDALNRLVTSTNPLSGTTVVAYDGLGNQTHFTSELGFGSTFEYDALGRLITKTDALSGTTVIAYDESGNVVRKTDAAGNVSTFEYDALGRLITSTNALSGTAINHYDAQGNLIAVTDTLGYRSTLGYDALDRLITKSNALSEVKQLAYDAAGNLVREINELGHITQHSYDALNRVISTTDALSGTVGYTYDARGQIVAVRDANGGVTRFAYDTLGQNTVITDALGHSTHFGYDRIGNQTVITDAKNYVTRSAYDGLGHVTVISDALGNHNTFSYDAAGHLTQTVDAEGRITSYAYDALERLITHTDALSGSTVIRYDALGNQISVRDARGYSTHYAYDPLSRVISVSNALSGTTSSAYDAAGNLINRSDARGNTVRSTYDALGRPLSISDPLSGTHSYSYDAAGNLIREVDAAGNATTYAYDALQRPVRISDALSGSTYIAYDAVGNQTVVTDANGSPVRFTYDAVNQVVQATDALSNSMRYAYDALGNQTVISDATGGATHFDYDALGQLVLASDPLDNRTTYAYDRVGNRTLVTNALGIVTQYGYNALNLMTSVVENYRPGEAATESTNVTTNYEYDARGNRTAVHDANQHTTRFTYDALGRVIQVSDPLSLTQHYTYDHVGNLIRQLDANGNTITMTYDALNRPVLLAYPDQTTVAYSYDKVGNRVLMTDSVGVTSYNYDEVYRIQAVTDPYSETVGYTYDAVGNRTSMSTPDGEITRYHYDAANRLSTVVDWTQGQTSYSYDAAGRVLTETLPNQTQTSHVYDVAGQLVSLEHNRGQQLLSRYEYQHNALGMREVVSETLVAPGTQLSADFVGTPLSGNAPLSVTFSDLSSGSIDSYLWDFGDGASSTLSNPMHIYNTAGVYTVNLSVSGSGGSDSEVKLSYIEVLTAACPVSDTLQDNTQGIATYRTLRDDIFAGAAVGQHYNALYQQHAWEVSLILATRPALLSEGRALLERWQGAVADLATLVMTNAAQGEITLNGSASEQVITAAEVEAAQAWLTNLREHSSSGLQAEIDAMLVQMEDFAGKTPQQVWEMLQEQFAEQRIYLPRVLRNNTSGGAQSDTTAAGGRGKALSSVASDIRSTLPDPTLLFMAPLLVLAVYGRKRKAKYIAWPIAGLLIGIAVVLLGLSLGTVTPTMAVALPSGSLKPQASGTRVITYSYDALNRLSAADYSSGEQYRYTYDAVGNRGSYSGPDGTRNYSYDAADRLIDMDGTSYTWDNNGNLLFDGERAFTYDYANRLVQVTKGLSRTDYVYSGDGVRLAKALNGQTTRYVVDQAAPLPQVLQERRAGGDVTYLHGLNVIGAQDSGTWAYQHPDALGSVRQSSDAAGNVQHVSSYTPFGVLAATEGQAPTSLGFTGEQQDVANGLIYLRARYYDPASGRFLNKDAYPAMSTVPQTLHRYAYVTNNPVNMTDPSGNWPKFVDDLAHAVTHPRETAERVWNGARDTAERTWDSARNTAERAWNSVRNTAESAWNSARNTVENTWNSARNTVESAWNSARNTVENTWNSVRNTATEWGNQARAEIERVVNSGIETISNLPNQIREGLSDAWDYTEGLRADINEGLHEAGRAIERAASDAVDYLSSPEGLRTVLVGAVVVGAVVLTAGTATPLLVPVLLGAGSGIAGQAIEDLISGDGMSSFGTYFEAAVLGSASGALMGAAMPVIGMVGSGAAAGGVGQGLANFIHGEPLHQGVLEATVIGGVSSGIGGAISGRFANGGIITRTAGEIISGGATGGGEQMLGNVWHGARSWNEITDGVGDAIISGGLTGGIDSLAESYVDHRTQAQNNDPVRPTAGDDANITSTRQRDAGDGVTPRPNEAALPVGALNGSTAEGRTPQASDTNSALRLSADATTSTSSHVDDTIARGSRARWDANVKRWRDPLTGRFVAHKDIVNAFLENNSHLSCVPENGESPSFWSGGPMPRGRAEMIGVTLGETPLGRAANDFITNNPQIPDHIAREYLWTPLSAKFATEVGRLYGRGGQYEGVEVLATLNIAPERRGEGHDIIYYDTEVDILGDTGVNLREFHIWSPTSN